MNDHERIDKLEDQARENRRRVDNIYNRVDETFRRATDKKQVEALILDGTEVIAQSVDTRFANLANVVIGLSNKVENLEVQALVEDPVSFDPVVRNRWEWDTFFIGMFVGVALTAILTTTGVITL
jgi:hypothetical protein